mgnify:CR=1 FL=1
MSMNSNKVKEQIILNISDESFVILHSESLDILDVYLVLSAALDYIEANAEKIGRASCRERVSSPV